MSVEQVKPVKSTQEKASVQNRVFVLDKNKQPLMPCTPARARLLLKKEKAAVFRMQPFTIILKKREGGERQTTRLSIDPGSKITGLCVSALFTRGWVVLWAAELLHRGHQIKEALEKRRAVRRSRRNRKTRYRQPRFSNRTKPKGWLAPSLRSRVDNIVNWLKRLDRFVGLDGIAVESVKFDMQKLQNPEISGVGYQQGTLFGYEVREYLLEKFHRTCVYCKKTGVPLEVEHILAKSQGGTDRVSNLVIACKPCNRKKDNQPIEAFLKNKPTLLASIQRQRQSPLKDAAAVNSTRQALVRGLQQAFPTLAIEQGRGGQTKYNRTQQGYPKAHWIDAACVGSVGGCIQLNPQQSVLQIQAVGRGRRQMCNVDKYGFPRSQAKGAKRVHGFQTGDRVKACVPDGKYKGDWAGRISIRANGSFALKTRGGQRIDVSYKHCKRVQQADGYDYTLQKKEQDA